MTKMKKVTRENLIQWLAERVITAPQATSDLTKNLPLVETLLRELGRDGDFGAMEKRIKELEDKVNIMGVVQDVKPAQPRGL